MPTASFSDGCTWAAKWNEHLFATAEFGYCHLLWVQFKLCTKIQDDQDHKMITDVFLSFQMPTLPHALQLLQFSRSHRHLISPPTCTPVHFPITSPSIRIPSHCLCSLTGCQNARLRLCISAFQILTLHVSGSSLPARCMNGLPLQTY